MSDVTTATALSGAGLDRYADAAGAGLHIHDTGVPSLLILRADPARSSLADALQSELGLSLPATLQSSVNGERVARWLSPDSWLVSVAPDELAAKAESLQSALGSHGAAVDVSGGYTLLVLSGPALTEVLKKSTAYDIHPDNFPPGKVISTTFAKAGATLRARDDGCCELIVRRSFAPYVFQWLANAADEYGLAVST